MGRDRSPRPPYQGSSGGGFVPPRGDFGSGRGDTRPPRPPFRPPSGDSPPTHSVRLREGDAEVEVSGSPIFIRQTLDDLPALLARLRGETPPKPAAIRMPSPPAEPNQPAMAPAATAHVVDATSVVRGSGHRSSPGEDGEDIENRVVGILQNQRRALPVAEIRAQLGPNVTGQQVRRVLERAGSRVAVSGERPAVYRLR